MRVRKHESRWPRALLVERRASPLAAFAGLVGVMLTLTTPPVISTAQPATYTCFIGIDFHQRYRPTLRVTGQR